jgi:hypothetical protein
MKTHAYANGRAHAPEVSTFLADVGEELSPSRLQAYIDEVKNLVPPGDYAALEGACRHLALAEAAVKQVARRLA